MAAILGHDGFAEWVTIVPSDTVDLENPCDAVWIATAGNLSFIDRTGTMVTIAVVASTFWPVPIQARRIRATGTTAVVIALRK